MVPPNTTVVLKCRPPYGLPQPNITWYKIDKHDGRRRIRSTSKKNLVIKCVQTGDSGGYQCEATNVVARRVGPVIKLEVRGLSFVGKSLHNTTIRLPGSIVSFKSQKGARIFPSLKRWTGEDMTRTQRLYRNPLSNTLLRNWFLTS